MLPVQLVQRKTGIALNRKSFLVDKLGFERTLSLFSSSDAS